MNMCSSAKINIFKPLQSPLVIIFLFSFFFSISFSVIPAIAQEEAQADVEAEQAEAATAQEPAAGAGGAVEGDVAKGKTLFTNNCTVCHALEKKLVGPALAGVTERRPVPWLVNFIRNSSKVIASGDEYAVNLYNQYNKMQMPAFALPEEDIKSILAYIEQAGSQPVPPTNEGGTTPNTPPVDVDGGGSSVPSEYLLAILGGLLIVLLLILVILILIVNMISKYISQKKDLDEDDKEYLDNKIDVKKVVKSKPFLGILAFIFAAVVLKAVVDGLFSIGIQQGYAPKQPIAFSHQIHAGQYEIDCQYCHTTVMKSKNASIPSVNICMNCHNTIKPESPEIQKIYAAIDYNPETREYGTNQRPIEWVRIHNLPDFAYFSHVQHTAVGGVSCQTCHGPVQEMQVVRQHSTLTMGWCINCHRETTVNTKGNEYYDDLVELHSTVSGEPLKVKDIGGLECSKCHY